MITIFVIAIGDVKYKQNSIEILKDYFSNKMVNLFILEEDDLSINYIKDLSQDLYKTYESQIYHLKNPRNFIDNGNYMIHPFHMPFTWDTYLSLMIIGLGIIIEK